MLANLTTLFDAVPIEASYSADGRAIQDDNKLSLLAPGRLNEGSTPRRWSGVSLVTPLMGPPLSAFSTILCRSHAAA